MCKYKMLLWKINNALHILIFGVSKHSLFCPSCPVPRFYNPMNCQDTPAKIRWLLSGFLFLSIIGYQLPSFLSLLWSPLHLLSKIVVKAGPYQLPPTKRELITNSFLLGFKTPLKGFVKYLASIFPVAVSAISSSFCYD